MNFRLFSTGSIFCSKDFQLSVHHSHVILLPSMIFPSRFRFLWGFTKNINKNESFMLLLKNFWKFSLRGLWGIIIFYSEIKILLSRLLKSFILQGLWQLGKKNESCSFYILRSDEHTHHNFLDFMQQSKLVSYFDTIFSKHMLNFPD
jgi:hypothetical protein